MNNEVLDGEHQFFLEGVRTYFDVDDAMTEFRRLVQHKCKAVASKRLDGINQACGMHWTAKDLSDYLQKFDDYHYIGKKVDIQGLDGVYFCLRFSRANDSAPLSAYVYLARKRKDTAKRLWELENPIPPVTQKSNHSLGFGRPVAEDGILDFEQYLDEAITDFLAFIKNNGGLQKYLV